jgi:hypothetical protein
MPGRGKPLMRAAREQLALGVAQIAVAVVFGVIALLGHRPLAIAAGVAFEAVFYGGFMWWFGFARLRRDVEAAPEIVDPVIRDRRTAARSFVLWMIGLVALLAVLTLLVPRSSIIAGIALGGGVDCLVFHRWLLRWESENSGEVLRLARWRRGKGVNNYRVTRATSV